MKRDASEMKAGIARGNDNYVCGRVCGWNSELYRRWCSIQTGGGSLM